MPVAGPEIHVRPAEVGDAAEIARLLHDFNTEFEVPSPGVSILAERSTTVPDGDPTGGWISRRRKNPDSEPKSRR